MHNLYPLKFNSIYKEKIWAGHRLRTLFGRDVSADKKIGESWEIADHGKDTTTIKNGPLAGKTLHDILQSAIRNPQSAGFPLLVKLIDTSEMLSVQVHPDDVYAQKYEAYGEQGKMEAWYIIHAEPGAKIVYGAIPGTTVDDVKKLLKAGRVEECLNFITVKAGDVIFIPPGMIHAIGAGILLLEVSQNSDVTYRLFDWNRLGEDGMPRPLHIKKALDVLNCQPPPSPPPSRGRIRERGAQSTIKREHLLDCPKFSLELLQFEKYIVVNPPSFGRKEVNNADNFHILSVIEGEGSLQYGEDKRDFVNFSKGESILVPASLKSYGIQPSKMCKIIKTSVP
ncbi:MAG TPA: type I phosphomannose isomerase catalytic subunit [Candidatus Brocadiia bacterium]|nr:class I mannose-6-phosphate isomerase [Planctomycetota bacterium]MDO8093315.1 class I mannose-6-phosphate isomerase [Candidatus Brocadiales bacterium]